MLWYVARQVPILIHTHAHITHTHVYSDFLFESVSCVSRSQEENRRGMSSSAGNRCCNGQTLVEPPARLTQNTAFVFGNTSICCQYARCLSSEPLEGFLKENHSPCLSNCVLPPSLVCASCCVAGGWSRVMEDAAMEPRGCDSLVFLYLPRLHSPHSQFSHIDSRSHRGPSRSRALATHEHAHVQYFHSKHLIQPKSVTFHVKQWCKPPGSFIRSDNLALQRGKTESQSWHYSLATPRCDKHILHCCFLKRCPSLCTVFHPSHWLFCWIQHGPHNSSCHTYVSPDARSHVCLDNVTLAATCFPDLIVHSLFSDRVRLWLLHLCHSKNIPVSTQ